MMNSVQGGIDIDDKDSLYGDILPFRDDRTDLFNEVEEPGVGDAIADRVSEIEYNDSTSLERIDVSKDKARSRNANASRWKDDRPSPVCRFDFTWHMEDSWKPVKDDINAFKKTLAIFCLKWIFKLEECPTNKRLHWQGRIHTRDRMRLHSLIRLCKELGLDKAIHWTVTSLGGYNRGMDFYVLKEETSCHRWGTDLVGPFSDRLELDDSPKYQIFRDLDAETNNRFFRAWQKQMIWMIRNHTWANQGLKWSMEKKKAVKDPIVRPEDRSIHFIIDEEGNNGKSFICRYLRWKKMAVTLSANGSVANMLAQCLDTDDHEAYIIEVNRGLPKATLNGMYTGIEQIKDGIFQDHRYKTRSREIQPPSVFVMMNYWPCRGWLSDDRYKLWIIGIDKNRDATGEKPWHRRLIPVTWDNAPKEKPYIGLKEIHEELVRRLPGRLVDSDSKQPYIEQTAVIESCKQLSKIQKQVNKDSNIEILSGLSTLQKRSMEHDQSLAIDKSKRYKEAIDGLSIGIVQAIEKGNGQPIEANGQCQESLKDYAERLSKDFAMIICGRDSKSDGILAHVSQTQKNMEDKIQAAIAQSKIYTDEVIENNTAKIKAELSEGFSSTLARLLPDRNGILNSSPQGGVSDLPDTVASADGLAMDKLYRDLNLALPKKDFAILWRIFRPLADRPKAIRSILRMSLARFEETCPSSEQNEEIDIANAADIDKLWATALSTPLINSADHSYIDRRLEEEAIDIQSCGIASCDTTGTGNRDDIDNGQTKCKARRKAVGNARGTVRARRGRKP